MWPISTRVNSPKNDDADLLKPLAHADACWPRDGNSCGSNLKGLELPNETPCIIIC